MGRTNLNVSPLMYVCVKAGSVLQRGGASEVP